MSPRVHATRFSLARTVALASTTTRSHGNTSARVPWASMASTASFVDALVKQTPAGITVPILAILRSSGLLSRLFRRDLP